VAIPVNFENLEDISRGDIDLMKQLLGAFMSAADNCLQFLQTAHEQHRDDDWKHQAHALKGVALNLGAEELSEICAHAQLQWHSSYEDKADMLKAIVAGLTDVRSAVTNYVTSPFKG
jgi:HPt (histidine-containing phosphotransfer) domain-containing protein